MRSVVERLEHAYRGWCNASSAEPGVAHSYTLRVTNGADENLLGTAQATLYDKLSLRNSFGFLAADARGTGIKLS